MHTAITWSQFVVFASYFSFDAHFDAILLFNRFIGLTGDLTAVPAALRLVQCHLLTTISV